MNAIKRFINLLKSPLMPMRMFAVDDTDSVESDFDFSEFGDEPSGYYDTDGNYLGDDAAAAEAAAESHGDSSINPDNWAENSDDFGDVDIQTDGNGNITGASYRDPETGEWKDSGLSGYQEAYGRTSEGQAKQAMDVFGASMTPEALAALNAAQSGDVKGLLDAAQKGDAESVALLSIITGTKPDADSLRGLGYTEEQINTLNNFVGEYGNAIRENKGPVDAWKAASSRTGHPYSNTGRTDMVSEQTWHQLYNAERLATGYRKPLTGDSDSEDKTPTASTASAKTSEPAARSEPKSDPVITGNPFDKGSPDISIPEGPLAGTPLSGTGLPGHESEPTKEDAEDRGFENDDSGSDTMEETSQDAPTSGLGGDTFSNPNDPSNNKGWGLGEEDPNRANYDTDKWNRGMERVSTDVVSDEKCKAFIKKTFKDDPVLIKTVKIMKTLK